MSEIIYDAFFQIYTDAFLPEKVYHFDFVVEEPKGIKKPFSAPPEGAVIRQHRQFQQMDDIIVIADPAYIKLGQSYAVDGSLSPANTPLYIDMGHWLESEYCNCPQCQKDGIKRRLDTGSHFGECLLRGNSVPEYIIPTDDTVSILITTEIFRKKLEQSPFKGYKITPVDDSEMRIEPSLRMALRHQGRKLQLSMIHFMGRIFPQALRMCEKCGWNSRGECEGGAKPAFCPNCKNPSLEFIYDNDEDEERFPMHRGDPRTFDIPPLPAHNWDGSDFIGYQPIISGRVARWLTENQIGPVCLCPCPTDISRCTEQQRQAIEQIRFKHPHAVAPKISK